MQGACFSVWENLKIFLRSGTRTGRLWMKAVVLKNKFGNFNMVLPIVISITQGFTSILKAKSWFIWPLTTKPMKNAPHRANIWSIIGHSRASPQENWQKKLALCPRHWFCMRMTGTPSSTVQRWYLQMRWVLIAIDFWTSTLSDSAHCSADESVYMHRRWIPLTPWLLHLLSSIASSISSILSFKLKINVLV